MKTFQNIFGSIVYLIYLLLCLALIAMSVNSYWPPAGVWDIAMLCFMGCVGVFILLGILIVLFSFFTILKTSQTLVDQSIIGLLLLVFVILVQAAFVFNFPYRSWFTNAWTVEFRLPQGQYIQTHSVDDNSGSWFFTLRKTNSYQVYHYTNKIEQTWDINYSGDNFYPEQVSADENGTLFLWLDNGIWQDANNHWKWIPYKPGINLAWPTEIIVSGTRGWAINQAHFVAVDALSGKWEEIRMPETAIQLNLSPIHIRRALNGDLMLLASNETDARLYLFTPEDQWRQQVYAFSGQEFYKVQDFFLDANASLWFLLESKKQDDWLVEKIAPTGEFSLTRLPFPGSRENGGWYDELVVDAQGHSWVTGDSFAITAFNPLWKGNAELLERYTNINSNYAGTQRAPVLSADGKIRVFGMTRISSLDTTQKLPDPLPDLVGLLLDEQTGRLLCAIAPLGFLLLKKKAQQTTAKKT
ncbi:MAG: hypothetical protein WA821_04430 [Anaerolineales bacterium]